MAILALALVIMGFTVVPIIPAIVGMVLALVALRKIKNSNGWLTGRPFAIAALWVGSLGIAAVAAFFAFMFFAMPNLFSEGSWHTTQPCKDSNWYSQVWPSTASLVPGATSSKVDFPGECWTDGGEFQVTVSTPEPTANLQDDVEAAARAHGWTGSDINPHCMQKTISGNVTYLGGGPEPEGPSTFWLGISTDSESYCNDFPKVPDFSDLP